MNGARRAASSRRWTRSRSLAASLVRENPLALRKEACVVPVAIETETQDRVVAVPRTWVMHEVGPPLKRHLSSMALIS